MHKVSTDYTRAMKEILRNRSYMFVNIGIINQQAQSASYIVNQDGLYLSNYDIFGTKVRRFYYAMFEQDFIKADGAMLFPPRESALNQTNGFISAGLVSQGEQYILIGFDNVAEVTVRGLTILFGDYYPTDFTIETDTETLTVTGNTTKRYETNYVFAATSSFKIKAVAMANANRRLRIEHIIFGVGVVFNNDNIKASTFKSYVSPISDDVPQIDFSVTIDNSNGDYNLENSDSPLNFFETGQEMEVQIGQELDDGTIEQFKIATLKMKSWNANDSVANFSAVDILETMDDTFYKGAYYGDGISLYDLAVQVFNDLGFESSTYKIDKYLMTVYTNNPLPKVKHKEALQIIANAGRCTLEINDEGQTVLEQAFITFAPKAVATSDSEASFSKVENIVTYGKKVQYATFENNYSLATGMTFIPKTAELLETGYISEAISGNDCVFAIPPSITVTLEAAFVCFSMRIVFDGNVPAGFTLKTYNYDVLVEELTITEVTQNDFTIVHDFQQFNVVVLTFTNTTVAYNRVRISSVTFGDVTDYNIDYTDLKTSPKGVQLEKVKDLNIVKTMYSQVASVDTEIYKGTYIVNSANNKITLQFNNPVYNISVGCEGYTATIVASGSYYIDIEIAGLPTTSTPVVIAVMGREFSTSTAMAAKVINTKGVIKTWTNPLISSDELASDVLDWIADYYASDREYELSYRGDPALESSDLFYLENEFNSSLMCRLYEHTINFNGALSGQIKARREADV